MKENIETKDVQRTEYLDKNGLDMLWAKVKENTHNQVEVERNRAVAEENSIDNKIDNLKYMPYVSKTNINSSELGDFVKYQLGATEFIISAQHGSNDARTEFGFGEVDFISVSKDSSVNIDYKCVTVGGDNNIKLTNTGIRKYINSYNPAGSATEAFSTDGGVIDTTAFALKSELDSYAKKTDIPEVDTSDFVSKTVTDAQSIKSELSVSNLLNIVDSSRNRPVIVLGTDGDNPELVMMHPENEKKSIRITTTSIQIGANLKDSMHISNYGIQSPDDNSEHVFTTNGGTANLFEYVRKENIGNGLNINDDGIVSVDAAGGNVDDVQVNGVSVVENKIANIKPATKESLGVVKVGDGLNVTDGTISVDTTAIGAGNYIPYKKTYESYYTIDGGLIISGEDCNSFYNKGSINFTYHNDSQLFNLSSNQIYGRVGNNSYTINAEDGIELRNETYRIAISGTNGLRMYATNDDARIAKTTQISENAIEFTDAQNGDYIFRINETGIHYNGRKENEIPTANGGFVNINNYALKSELPTVPTKVSQLQNDSEFIAKSVYDEKIAALEARIAALEAKHAEAV